MPQRKCTKTKEKVTRANKRITLQIEMKDYKTIVEDSKAYREWVDEMIREHPELFPKAIAGGYTLHDDRGSTKMEDIHLRRISLKELDERAILTG